MYNRSVFLTSSVFTLCIGLGMPSAWAMEVKEDADHQPRVLPSKQSDKKIQDEMLSWTPQQWNAQMHQALTSPDKGEALFTAWANDPMLGWEKRIIAARNLPDNGKAILTAWAHDKDLDWKTRGSAAIWLFDKGEVIFTTWANDKDLDWTTRMNAAFNLPDKGVAFFTAWVNDKDLDWKARLDAAVNLPDKGVGSVIAWANDPKSHPRLRLAGIRIMKDQASKSRLYLEILSDKKLDINDRLISWEALKETKELISLQKTRMERKLVEILEESKKSIVGFLDAIKELSKESQTELLKKILQQTGLNSADKEKIERALKTLATQVNKSSATPPVRDNNNNASSMVSLEEFLIQKGLNSADKEKIESALKTLTTKENKSSVTPSVRDTKDNTSPATSIAAGALKKKSLRERIKDSLSAQDSNPQGGIPESKQEEKVAPSAKSKEKKGKKNSKLSKQPDEKKSDEKTLEELADLVRREALIRAAEKEEVKKEEEARKKRHETRNTSRLNNNNTSDSDASSEDDSSTDSSSSDSESNHEAKVKRANEREAKAIIRREAYGYLVNARKEGQTPDALDLVKRIVGQAVNKKLLHVAENALQKVDRVRGFFTSNNNTSMEKEEESYEVETLDISSAQFNKPEAATKKYNELVEAFKTTSTPSIGKVKKLKDVTENGIIKYSLYSAKLSKGDRLVYTIVGSTIKHLFVGDHKAYERFLERNNITIDSGDQAKDEAA